MGFLRSNKVKVFLTEVSGYFSVSSKSRMTIPSSDGFFNGGSCLPCTPEEEKRIVDDLEAAAVSNRKEGDLYYIVSGRSVFLFLFFLIVFLLVSYLILSADFTIVSIIY